MSPHLGPEPSQLDCLGAPLGGEPKPVAGPAHVRFAPMDEPASREGLRRRGVQLV